MPGKDRKILIIDDSNTNAFLLETILRNNGYEIQKALSAGEAMSFIKREMPDLILLDLLMPQISGHEFLEYIRKNNHTKDIPVILVTAVTEKKIKEMMQTLDIFDYLEKPVDLKVLIEKVQKVFSNNKQKNQSENQ